MTFYRFGLLGYPLGHSLSPRLHQAAFRLLDLNGTYELFPIPDGQQAGHELVALMESMQQGVVQGLNVTIPYKISLLPFLDELSPEAVAIGAVNTVVCKGNKLVGENYDCPAFQADLAACLERAGMEGLDRRVERNALVLGAGGSARAVVFGLLKDGWQVLVAARRLEQAHALASAFAKSSNLSVCRLIDLATHKLEGIHLIVNTTPLGMYPDNSTSAWPAGLGLPPRALVYDLVYNPTETILMARARMAGLPTANGLGMLARQAALSFQAWTGKTPDWQAMYCSLDPDKVSK